MNPSQPIDRRTFLEQGAVGAVVVGTSAEAQAASRAPGAQDNPWRYDMDRLREVDPALVGYERERLFSVGHAPARRLGLGAGDEILVAAGRSVLVYTEHVQAAGQWPALEPVRCVRSADDGRIWVGFRAHVELWDRTGKRLKRWPAFEGKPFLTGLAVLEGRVYVADAGNRVVYRCDGQGRVELRMGEKNEARGIPGLVVPSPYLDVEAGEDGLLRVTNPGRHRVEVYTPDGDLEGSWGRPGAAVGSFCGCCNPVGLALLDGGRCVTAEKGLPRVTVFAADGRLESVVAVPDQFAPVASDARTDRWLETSHDALDVVVDRSGRVVVLDGVGGTIHVYRRKSGGPPAG